MALIGAPLESGRPERRDDRSLRRQPRHARIDIRRAAQLRSGDFAAANRSTPTILLEVLAKG